MKLPRDINAKDLIHNLNKIGYQQSRQVGSHIRLSITIKESHFTLQSPTTIRSRSERSMVF